MPGKKVLVLGSGVMGAGIAQYLVQAGEEVIIMSYRAFDRLLRNDQVDGSEFSNLVERGLDKVKSSINKASKKGKLSNEDAQAAINKLQGMNSLDELSDVWCVIECIQEDMELKQRLFKELDNLCSSDTYFTTNTSSLSITEIASATNRMDKVMGVHFFNPPVLIPLVELVRGKATSDATFSKLEEFLQSIEMDPIEVNESPAFVLNRILIPMINEAAFVKMEGVAKAEDIDKVMKGVANLWVGPLAMADYIGLDVILRIMTTLYEEFGDPKYRPCPLIRNLVRAGYTGRKTGKGFYTY